MALRLTNLQIETLLNTFLGSRRVNHRYSSFDLCYSYFNSFKNKEDIIASKQMEQSCLQLGYYLASWGMLRGSSFLLRNENVKIYEKVLETAINQPKSIWSIDADSYNESTIPILIEAYKEISNSFDNKTTKTLVTKVMLGIFGNVPAFDTYVTSTYRKVFEDKCAFRSFNSKSLECLNIFFHDHQATINQFQKKTYCYKFDGTFSKTTYPKAKLLDTIAFQYGIQY